MQVTGGTLRLRALGPPSLTDALGKSPPSLGWGKPLALLCFLAIRREARRDEVVDLLWRDMPPEKARNTFRQALHRLRSALGDEILPPDRDAVRLVVNDRLSIDLREFDEAVAAGRTAQAIDLYRGDFLEATELGEPAFDLWADQERTRIRARFRQVLHDSVRESASAGRAAEAIARSRRLLALAPFDAQVAELAATTLVSAGRADDARELLRSFGERLQAELGVPMPPDLHAFQARLQRQASQPSQRGPSAPPLGFAGREAEIAQLIALWKTTGEDAGTFALVEGAPGIGRSRLVSEFVSHVRTLGAALVLRGREHPPGTQLPLGIFAEALRPLVRAPGVAGASRHLLAEAARLLPELRDSFDLPEVRDVSDEAARLRFFEGLAALVDAAAYEQAVLLLVEDAHLLPPSSLDLLSYMRARLAGSAVMMVVTTRQLHHTPVGERLRSLVTDASNARHLTLAPLTREASFIALERAVRDAGLTADMATRIVDAADGDPTQLAAGLRRALAGETVDPHPVPVRELIQDRVQRLTSAQRRFLLVLAMVGRPLPAALAASAAHVSLGAADEMVSVLERQGLVDLGETGVSASAGAAELLLQGADAATRGFLAGWIVDALAAQPGAPAAELARFHALAGQPDRAFEASRRAAFDAFAIGAFAEALSFLQTARGYASDPVAQAEIESLLVATGSGRLRIAPPDSLSPPAVETVAPRRAADERQHPTARWAAAVPNWRFLVGAAVATLVVSAVVLAARDVPVVSTTTGSADTLVVAEDETGRTVRYATGDLGGGFILSERVRAPGPASWFDSLASSAPGALVAPGREHVAVVLRDANTVALFVIPADRRDTVEVAAVPGDVRPLAWSPDGQWLLFTVTGPNDGAYDADLFAYRLGSSAPAAIDSSARRSVTEALWSPDGSRIAWVAQSGAQRQGEVFVSFSDGSHVVNVSRHPADDHRIAWSGDGDLLAFTSQRDGNAELYAVSVAEQRLWRLTRDPAQDDRASFSASGRLVAFESTRGGVAGVYVMPALGGDAKRVGAEPGLSIQHWRGPGRHFVGRVRVQSERIPVVGDSTRLSLLAYDQQGDAVAPRAASWRVLDTTIAVLSLPRDSLDVGRTLIARRPGLARVVASIGEWRADTALVRIGVEPVPLLSFTAGPGWRDAWLPLGQPEPTFGARERAIALNADRDWDSGVLSRQRVPILPTLELAATLRLEPSRRDPGTSVNLALVAPEPPDAIDIVAPQFLRLASITWTADPGRFVFAVGREVHTAPVAGRADSAVVLAIRVESDSTVTFHVDGQQRWRSTLRVITERQDGRAHVWIGGRATGDGIAILRSRLQFGAVASP